MVSPTEKDISQTFSFEEMANRSGKKRGGKKKPTAACHSIVISLLYKFEGRFVQLSHLATEILSSLQS